MVPLPVCKEVFMQKTNKGKMKFSRDGLVAGLMLTPAVIFLIVCSIYPFIWIFRYICYDYNGFTATFTGKIGRAHV